MRLKRPATPTQYSRADAGFTLIETIIVMAILAILALFSFPAIHTMIIRSNLEGSARQSTTFFRLARLEAIKNSTPVVVTFNLTDSTFAAFADLNIADGSPGSDLVFNPVGGAPYKTTDYEVLPPMVLTSGKLDFGGPTADPAVLDGFTLAPSGDTVLIFNADGTVVHAGGLRIKDTNENFLEIAVRPRTSGKVTLQKWHRDDGVWYTRGRKNAPGGTTTTWEWYP